MTPSTRPRPDMLSLTTGVLFVALGVGFLLDAADVVHIDVSWIWPAVLIALGLGWMFAGWDRRRDE